MATMQEVNSQLPRLNIRGKEYVDVAARVSGFRALYPAGRIVTTKTSDDGQRCDFRAEVYDGDVLLATGHAFEDRKGNVNSTSYVENCETGAVGRALGFLGIGSTTSIASADEVQAALAQRTLASEKRRLAEACKAYERQTGRDADPGWAAAGVKRRPDYPPADMPEAEQAEWFGKVADEFEAEVRNNGGVA